VCCDTVHSLGIQPSYDYWHFTRFTKNI